MIKACQLANKTCIHHYVLLKYVCFTDRSRDRTLRTARGNDPLTVVECLTLAPPPPGLLSDPMTSAASRVTRSACQSSRITAKLQFVLAQESYFLHIACA